MSLSAKEAPPPPQAKATSAGVWWRRYLGLVVVALVLLMAFAIVYFWKDLAGLQRYGYVGAFVISLVTSATVVIPAPGLAVIFALSTVVDHPWLLGLMVGAGSSLGEMSGFLVGTVGRVAFQKNPSPTYLRLERWMKRRGGLVIFIFAAVPFTVFDLVGIVAGALEYPLWRFFLFCWGGKTVKGMLVAYAGAWGFKFITDWFKFW